MHQVKKVRLDYLGLEEAVVSVENLEDLEDLGSKAKRARLVKVDPLEIKVHQDQKVLLTSRSCWWTWNTRATGPER